MTAMLYDLEAAAADNADLRLENELEKTKLLEMRDMEKWVYERVIEFMFFVNFSLINPIIIFYCLCST